MSHHKRPRNPSAQYEPRFTIGVPIKLLHEAIGFVCTIETKNGSIYRGTVLNVDDNFNVQIQNALHVSPQGHKIQTSNVCVRGSQVVFIILPDMLKNSANLQPRQLANEIRDHDNRREAEPDSSSAAVKRQRV